MLRLDRKLVGLVACGVLGACNAGDEDTESQRIDHVDSDSPYDGLMQDFPPEVIVETIPSVSYGYMAMHGSYSQHELAIEKLLEIANDTATKAVIAIYPDDPDLVAEADLAWKIGLELAAGETPTTELRTGRIEGSLVAKLPSTVSDTPGDGKKLLAWIDLNGYVQTQPTMMRFPLKELQNNLGDPAVEIIIPVDKRGHF